MAPAMSHNNESPATGALATWSLGSAHFSRQTRAGNPDQPSRMIHWSIEKSSHAPLEDRWSTNVIGVLFSSLLDAVVHFLERAAFDQRLEFLKCLRGKGWEGCNMRAGTVEHCPLQLLAYAAQPSPCHIVDI